MINWGIIGLGNIAKRFAESLSHSKRGRLYAVASRSIEKGQHYQKKYGCISYQSYQELLEDKKIDVIYIALPPGLHLEWVLKALKQKKAVLCEKPSAISEKEIREMVESAKEEQVFFMEAMKARFGPCAKKLVTELGKNIIGEVTRVSASFCANVDKLHRNCYYYDVGQGGTLLDMGPYPVAFCMSILGNEPMKIESKLVLDDNGIDHHVSGTLYYADGKIGEVEVAFDEDKERKAVIYGTKGRIQIPFYYRAQEYTVFLNNGKTDTEYCSLAVDDMFDEIEEVHECITSGLYESRYFGWQDSIDEIKILDQIRRNGCKGISA